MSSSAETLVQFSKQEKNILNQKLDGMDDNMKD